MAGVDVPHLAWPLRRCGRRLRTVEQDTIDDVRQCVRVLLHTPRGARPLAPAIGVEDPTFTDGVDGDLLAAELEEQEDRAEIRVTADAVTAQGQQTVRVQVALAGANDELEDEDL